jgi:hypothetical protein
MELSRNSYRTSAPPGVCAWRHLDRQRFRVNASNSVRHALGVGALARAASRTSIAIRERPPGNRLTKGDFPFGKRHK